MAAQHVPTFEEVDKHVQALDLAQFQAGGAHFSAVAAAKANAAGALGSVCAAYKAVRPILVIVANLPILPAKWKALVQTFIQVMDKLCP